MKSTCMLVVLLFASTLPALPSAANEVWPAWRGPTKNGHAAATAKPPVEWTENKNVKWKAEIPGLGCSTPSVWDNKVILTYARPTGRKIEVEQTDSKPPKPNEFQELFVAAYELESGKQLWQTKGSEAVPHEKGHRTGSYASASTVTDGKGIYAFFGSLGLFALDMDGNQLWDRPFPQMTTVAEFGEGASPALQDNMLVIPWDEEGQSFVAGIDTATGKEAWQTLRETDSAWTTPLIVGDGQRFMAVVAGSKQTRAYDLQSGKEVWRCGGMPMNPTSSPVADGDVVFIANNYRGKTVQAIRFAGASGDISQTEHLLWTYDKSASYVPTPVVVDGRLYFLKGSAGILVCLDASTGDVVFAGNRIGLRNIHASPMVANGRIYIPSREGDTAVIDPSEDCKILAKNHLDDVFDASPVAIGSRLILRGRTNLYCIE